MQYSENCAAIARKLIVESSNKELNSQLPFIFTRYERMNIVNYKDVISCKLAVAHLMVGINAAYSKKS